ncbi:MAG: COX15/CtaA family protein, partial [Bdellovibrionales bacterium]|nr:COX15/CtaA family protein [Bdellovibrionales bacterium]
MVSPRFLKAYRFLCYEVLFLIALGGSVRTMNAGLACPDWPLCFGEFIPDFHIQVYFEFIHRVLAGSLSLLVFGFGIYLLRQARIGKLVKLLSGIAMCLVVIQVIVGGLTVLMLLKESVVTLHLVLATALFACVLIVYWELKSAQERTIFVGAPRVLKHFAHILTGSIWVQIVLGGLVASHYAGLVCPDFPLCHGQFAPTLTGPIGLQVIHRLGAYLCVLLICGFWITVKQLLPSGNPLVLKWSKRLLIGIWIQVGLGIANIFFSTPPLIVVLHLFTGTLLLGMA